MSQTNFPLSISLRIDWSELDLFGHVNNVMFFKYIQAARVNYWETIGINKTFTQTKIGPILLSTSCQFKKQLQYPGTVTVKSGINFIKNTSFGLHHQLIDQHGDLVAEAEDVIVMFDFSKNEKVPVSAEMRAMVEKLEGRTL
jgi:acyl-CoA thioester hydrolase